MSLVDVCVVIPVLFSWFKSKEYTHLKKAIKPFVNRRGLCLLKPSLPYYDGQQID